jgi:hypothetical protein
VRELVGGGGNLWSDDVEHGGGTYRSAKPESSSESQRLCCRRRHSRRSLNPSHDRTISSNSEYPKPKTFWKIFTIRRSKKDMPESSSVTAVVLVESWAVMPWFVCGASAACVVTGLAVEKFLATLWPPKATGAGFAG